MISRSISTASSESAVWLGLKHVGRSVRGLGFVGLWLWSGRCGLCALRYSVWCLRVNERVEGVDGRTAIKLILVPPPVIGM
jgi:hypothetical protein